MLDTSYVIIGERGQCVPQLASGYMLAYTFGEYEGESGEERKVWESLPLAPYITI